VEFFAIDSALRPMTSIFAFSSLYVFLPLLSFALALILCASGANLFLKLLFPVVSLIAIPLGYPLIEADGYLNSNLSLEHFSADFGLALLVAFSPAALGTAVGLIIRAVGKRTKIPSKTTVTAQKSVNTRTAAGARRGSGARTRSGSGTRRKVRSGTGPPPLTVRLNTATRTQLNARSNAGVRMLPGGGMRSTMGTGTKTHSSTVTPSNSRSKKQR
jgi:hypothetical protein